MFNGRSLEKLWMTYYTLFVFNWNACPLEKKKKKEKKLLCIGSQINKIIYMKEICCARVENNE